MRHRWITLGITVLLLAAGVAGMQFTTKQFFPPSDRAEILVDLWLPEGASLAATRAQSEQLESWLARDDDVQSFVAYVGNGSPRPSRCSSASGDPMSARSSATPTGCWRWSAPTPTPSNRT